MFSSWLFPWNVQERGGGRNRRQAQRRPCFPDGLYHIDWLVKYISYHIKPAQGHDSSLGRKVWLSQRLLENKLTRCSAVAATDKATTMAVEFLHVLLSSRLQQHQERVDLFDLRANKKCFKHDLFYLKPHSPSGEIFFEKKFLWSPYYNMTHGSGNKNIQEKNPEMVKTHYSDL